MDKAHLPCRGPPRANTRWYEGAKPWLGTPSPVRTVTVAGMGSLVRQGLWSKRVRAGGRRGHGVTRAKRVWSCVLGQRMTASMPIQHCLRPRGARWRQAMRDRAPARSVEGDKETGWAWLHRGASPWRPVLWSCWHDLPVSACPLDEWGSCVPPKAAQLPGATSSGAPSGDAWVWIALAPGWRLVCACGSGQRDQAGAAWLLARVAPVTDDAMPLCPSDQLPA